MSRKLKNKEQANAAIPPKKYFADKSLIFLLIITLIVYFKVSSFELLNFDDHWYIIENEYLKTFDLKTVIEIFTSFIGGQYSPLSLLSLSVLKNIFGQQSSGFHIFNLVLHSCNIGLVYFLVKKISKRYFPNYQILLATTTAAFFALHPLQVEAVAWVSAVKIMLYSLFFLLASLSYIKYIENKQIKDYFLSLLFFTLSFFSKEQAVAFALVTVAFDFYYQRKLFETKVLIEKIPFFTLALIFGTITLFASQSDAGYTFTSNSLGERFLVAAYALDMYAIKILSPFEQTPYYAYPQFADGLPFYLYTALLAPIALLSGLFLNWKSNKPAAFALLFFIANLALPLVLLLVAKRAVYFADRYAYLPSIGAFFLFSIFLVKFLKYKTLSRVYRIVLIFMLILFSTASYFRVSVWRNSIELWNSAIEVSPEVPFLYFKRAEAWTLKNDVEKSLADYNKALELKPDYMNALIDRGAILAQNGRAQEAIADFDLVLATTPQNTGVLSNRANSYFILKQYDKALADYNSVIELNPRSEDVYLNRGNTLINLNRFEEALSDFNKCIALNFNYHLVYLLRGVANDNLNKPQEAITDFDRCISLNPKNSTAYLYRGYIKARNNDKANACNDLQTALKMGETQAKMLIEQFCK